MKTNIIGGVNVDVIKSHWNDTDTVLLVGKMGRIVLYRKTSSFLGIMFDHLPEPVTLHISEVKFKTKN